MNAKTLFFVVFLMFGFLQNLSAETFRVLLPAGSNAWKEAKKHTGNGNTFGFATYKNAKTGKVLNLSNAKTGKATKRQLARFRKLAPGTIMEIPMQLVLPQYRAGYDEFVRKYRASLSVANLSTVSPETFTIPSAPKPQTPVTTHFNFYLWGAVWGTLLLVLAGIFCFVLLTKPFVARDRNRESVYAAAKRHSTAFCEKFKYRNNSDINTDLIRCWAFTIPRTGYFVIIAWRNSKYSDIARRAAAASEEDPVLDWDHDPETEQNEILNSLNHTTVIQPIKRIHMFGKHVWLFRTHSVQ